MCPLRLYECQGTSSNSIDLAEVIALLVQLADESGDILRDVAARPDKGVTDKGGEIDVSGEYVADPQTAADREVWARVSHNFRYHPAGVQIKVGRYVGSRTNSIPSMVKYIKIR